MHKFTLLPIIAISALLSSCGSPTGKVSYEESPKIANVSSYDPKEKQRRGRSYTPLNQKALKDNGILGQIARCSKGLVADTKCGRFLKGAEKQGFMLGTYHYVTTGVDPGLQAEFYVTQLRKIRKQYNIYTNKILLVADIDTNCTAAQAVRFVTRIKELTGTYPLVYIENGEAIRKELRNATPKQKSILKKCPYWLALYSDNYPGIPSPQALIRATGVWDSWAMWQYGGVEWENGRSTPKYYRSGEWKTPKYLGNLSVPLERNGFNGSKEELRTFWNRNAWHWELHYSPPR